MDIASISAGFGFCAYVDWQFCDHLSENAFQTYNPV
jgi:hypothetical protein